ncbi:terminase small subunit [Tautonia rosea]|uniref:terminase small subunit n=1 Tax=Tautonia rosea TaxID=2728037 RepID=UPI001474AADB|nr:terminase small subunit [Tautonia rosea]
MSEYKLEKSPGPPADVMAGLNHRQRSFVLGIIEGLSAVQAAKRAGYAQPVAKASRVMAHPAVARAIEAMAEQHAMRAGEVLLRISEIAAFDPATVAGKVYTTAEDGRRVVDWDAVERLNVGRFIQRIGMHGKSGHEQIYWYSRADALSHLSKIHGLTSEGSTVSINVDSMSIDELKAVITGK